MFDRPWHALNRKVILTCLLAFVVVLAATSVVLASGATGPSAAPDTAKCKTHVVKRGETLGAVAAKYGVTVRSIANANQIANVNRIRAGQRLCIPGTVKTAEKPALKPLKVWIDPGVAIEVLSPVEGGSYHSPIELIGFSKTFEGVVHIRLKDAGTSEVMGERQVLGGGVQHEFFRTYIRFETFSEGPQAAVLEFYEIDPATGGEINMMAMNVILLPGQRVIDVWSPKVGEIICDPFDVVGYSWTFEANVPLELQDRSGSVMNESFGMGGGVMYDVFDGELNPGTDVPTAALASAFEASARDGSHIDETRIPISILPSCKPPKKPGNG
ncbi:MAG: LysM peptidoglycan-binding domain-containing protein [Caldilineales bacterium]|nr:LysM peptidoglycan-binding domain-containing protein [Caldilineales bacterium]